MTVRSDKTFNMYSYDTDKETFNVCLVQSDMWKHKLHTLCSDDDHLHGSIHFMIFFLFFMTIAQKETCMT